MKIESSLQSYQEKVDQWIKTYGVRYFNELTNMAILTEEVGEVSRMIARIYGEQSFKNEIEEQSAKAKLADELADVIFVVACIANQTGIDLSNAVDKNFIKKSSRDKLRHHGNRKIT